MFWILTMVDVSSDLKKNRLKKTYKYKDILNIARVLKKIIYFSFFAQS